MPEHGIYRTLAKPRLELLRTGGEIQGKAPSFQAVSRGIIRVSTAFLAAACSMLWAAEDADTGPEQDSNAAAPSYFDSNGTAIHYTDTGKPGGPPIVLIHGLLVDQALNWASARRVFATDFRVIAMDVRGHGRSEGPHDAARYGPEIALDVIRLLDHLDIARASVFGYSMGGMIATWLAARFPERLHVAVIGGYAPSSLIDDAQHLDPEKHPVGLALREAMASGRSVPDTLVEQNARHAHLPVYRYEPILEFYEELREIRIDPVAVGHVLRSLPDLRVSYEELAAGNVPLIAAAGDRDPSYPGILELRAHIPETMLLLIPNLGHINAYKSELFARAVADSLLHPGYGARFRLD